MATVTLLSASLFQHLIHASVIGYHHHGLSKEYLTCAHDRKITQSNLGMAASVQGSAFQDVEMRLHLETITEFMVTAYSPPQHVPIAESYNAECYHNLSSNP